MWPQDNHRPGGAGGEVFGARPLSPPPHYHFRNNAGQPPKTHTPLFCISQLFSFKFSNNRITLSLFVPRGFVKFISNQNKQRIISPNLFRRNSTKISRYHFQS